jgi:N-sulfoglucosamine sulfohydrolase
MRLRTVRDARYRYIRTFNPEVPFFAPNAYKARQYPAWNLIQELAKGNQLDPIQAVLAAPTQPAEQLFDLTEDPHEIRNLVASTKPEHVAALTRLRAELESWIVRTDDQGRIPEKFSPTDADARVRAKQGKKKK